MGISEPSGGRPAGSGRITSFDVARAANVSQSTVSRALRGDPAIGPETVRRVRAAAAALDYVPSERARDLSNGKTRRVAMVVDLDNPLWALLVRGLYDLLAANDLRMTLLAAHGESDIVDSTLRGGGIDGAILTTIGLGSDLPLALARRGVPTVLLQRYTDQGGVDSSVADNREGGMAAARMLLDAGHTRIGAIFGSDDASTSRDREAGFRWQLDQAGVSLDEAMVVRGSFELAHGELSIATLLDAPSRPSAVFCANDNIAFGALGVAVTRGFAVPDDIALVGFDDLAQAGWPSISLSTIHVPFDDMIHSAVTMLMERIGGWSGEARRVVHPVRPLPRSTHGR